jgi:hypothetical protein
MPHGWHTRNEDLATVAPGIKEIILIQITRWNISLQSGIGYIGPAGRGASSAAFAGTAAYNYKCNQQNSRNSDDNPSP